MNNSNNSSRVARGCGLEMRTIWRRGSNAAEKKDH